MGKVTTCLPSQLHPRTPRSSGLSPPAGSPTTPKGGVAFPHQPSCFLPGDSVSFSKDPPLSGRPRKGGTGVRPAPATGSPRSPRRLRSRPGCPPSRSPLLTCSADTAPFPAPPPLLLPARPLLSAIFAACWASGLRGSAPPCVTSGLGVTAHSPRCPCLQAALRFGSCGWFWLCLHVGPTTCPAGRGEFRLRRFNLCNRDTAPGRGGKDGLTGEWGRGLGSGCQCPLPTTGWWERREGEFPLRDSGISGRGRFAQYSCAGARSRREAGKNKEVSRR